MLRAVDVRLILVDRMLAEWKDQVIWAAGIWSSFFGEMKTVGMSELSGIWARDGDSFVSGM